MRRALSIALLVLGACSTGGTAAPDATPSVPDAPRVLAPVVEKHAQQFDEDLPVRPAGSQEEVAAGSYIIGHLQLAGYTVRLDSVPVADQVKASNIVALPPSGDDPAAVVVVRYDTDPGSDEGESIGLFLELARALRIREPEHRVEFVAVSGGRGMEEVAGAVEEAGDVELIRIGAEDLDSPDDLLTSLEQVGG